MKKQLVVFNRVNQSEESRWDNFGDAARELVNRNSAQIGIRVLHSGDHVAYAGRANEVDLSNISNPVDRVLLVGHYRLELGILCQQGIKIGRIAGIKIETTEI